MFDFSSNFFRFESDIIRWIHLEIIKKRAVAMKKIISNRSWAKQFFFFLHQTSIFDIFRELKKEIFSRE